MGIGGAEIYRFLDITDELYLTRIDYDYKCDTFSIKFEENFVRNIDFHSVNDMFDDEKKLIPMEIQQYVKNHVYNNTFFYNGWCKDSNTKKIRNRDYFCCFSIHILHCCK